MATHSSVLAWRIPGTGEPGGLPSLGSHRVGHDWSDLAAAAAAAYICQSQYPRPSHPPFPLWCPYIYFLPLCLYFYFANKVLYLHPESQAGWGICPLAAAATKSLQSCPTLCDPIEGSPPGSPIPGILQARTLDWVAIASPMHESEKWKWSRSVVSDS